MKTRIRSTAFRLAELAPVRVFGRAAVFALAAMLAGSAASAQEPGSGGEERGDPRSERQRADAKAASVERSPYAAALDKAVRRLEKGDPRGARASLETCEPELRGFEWNHLALMVALAAESMPSSAPAPDARRPSASEPVLARRAPTISAVTVLRSHAGIVFRAAFSPDGSRLASAGADRAIRVWDAGTCALRHVMTGHESDIYFVAWRPDGQQLVSGSNDTTARVWDAIAGSEMLAIRGHETAVGPVAFSSDGLRVLTGSGDRSARVWDASSGSALMNMRGHERLLTAVSTNPSGERILTSSEDGTVRLWNAVSGEAGLVLRGHDGPLFMAAFDRSGEHIASASGDRTVRIWNTETGECERVLTGHEGWVFSIAWSPDGSRLASSSRDGTVRVWNVASGEMLLSLKGHEGHVHSVAFDPLGARLVSAGADGSVRIYETERAGAERAQVARRLELPTGEAALDMKPSEIDKLCWSIVCRPDLELDTYARTAALLEATLERSPDNAKLMTTLAGAKYRLGRFKPALRDLDAAQAAKPGLPGQWGFRALARAQLKEADDARTALERFGIVMDEKRWNGDPELEGLWSEARALVEALPRK